MSRTSRAASNRRRAAARNAAGNGNGNGDGTAASGTAGEQQAVHFSDDAPAVGGHGAGHLPAGAEQVLDDLEEGERHDADELDRVEPDGDGARAHEGPDEPAYDDEAAYDDGRHDESAYDEAAAGAEPPRDGGRYGPLESVMRRPRAAALPVVVCVTIAVLLGLLRPPVYTAEAQLIVGGVVRDYQPAAGQSDAVKELTDIYSRLVGSADHQQRVSEALGTEVPVGVLSAAPIPDSALIRLEASGSSDQEAIDRANAGADQLAAEVKDLKAQASNADQDLLKQLDQASAALSAAQIDLDAKQAAYNSAVNSGASAAAVENARQAFVAAEGAATTAKLKVDVLSSNYSSSASARSGGIDLAVFSKADVASSDRTKRLALYVFAGLVIGGLLGMALATLVANGWKLLPDRGRSPAEG